MYKARAILPACFLLSVLVSYGQAGTKKINAGGFEFQMSTVDPVENDDFCMVGQMPEFPGGVNKLVAFAKAKIHYPASAVNDNVEGSVVLSFIIDKRGRVTNKKVFKGVRVDLNSVCLRMLNQMPNWKPGRLNGKAVAVKLKWTIIFVLDD